VDVDAMHEAMTGGGPDERYASSRAYFFYLRAQLLASENDHRGALEDLRQAEIYDPDSPEIRVALAEQLARLGELARAEEELRRALVRNRHDAPTLVAMGRLLAEEKKLSKAVVPLRRALVLKPSDVNAAMVLAQVELELGHADAAIKAIEAQSRAAPDEAAGFKFLGQALMEHGDARRAEHALRQAKLRGPGDPETLQSLAKLLEDQNRLGEAMAAYDEALGTDPDEPNVLLGAGTLALRRGDFPAAKAYFDQLVGVMPDDVDVKVKVAFAWFGAHRLHEAGGLLDDARKALPTEPRLAFYAGLIHEEEKGFEAASEAFNAVDRAADLYPEARLHLGICLSEAGHHTAAMAALRQGLLDHPGARSILVALADAQARSGDLRGAVGLLQKAADDQGSDELYSSLADLLARNGDPGGGVAALQRAISSHAGHPRLVYALALAHAKNADRARALETMRELLKLEPENANALNFIAYTLAESGAELDEAERLVKRALMLRPESGAFTDSLGWVLFKRGEYRQAVEALQRAEALTPNEPVIIEHLADALSRAARRTDASEAYRRALRLLDASDAPARAELERKLKAVSVQQAGN
jgi:predicted Zn-dependent protease